MPSSLLTINDLHLLDPARRQPLYLLSQPSDIPEPKFTSAYVSRPVPLAIRDKLKASGEWRGQGACIVTCDKQIAGDVFGTDSTFTRLYNRTVLHELAHVVCGSDEPLTDLEPSDIIREIQTLKFESWAAMDSSPPAVEPWQDHNEHFVRAALHLVHRARELGFDVLGYGVAAGATYGLSAAQHYATALGDELTRLAHLAVREILDTELPPKFSKQFAADCAAYQKEKSL